MAVAAQTSTIVAKEQRAISMATPKRRRARMGTRRARDSRGARSLKQRGVRRGHWCAPFAGCA
jgi:hypothetical protein